MTVRASASEQHHHSGLVGVCPPPRKLCGGSSTCVKHAMNGTRLRLRLTPCAPVWLNSSQVGTARHKPVWPVTSVALQKTVFTLMQQLNSRRKSLNMCLARIGSLPALPQGLVFIQLGHSFHKTRLENASHLTLLLPPLLTACEPPCVPLEGQLNLG
jgi:hypothetical protein